MISGGGIYAQVHTVHNLLHVHTHTHTHTLTCINYTGGPAVGGSMGTTPPAGWLPALPTFGRTGMVLPPGGPPPLIRLPASSSASMSVPTIAPLVTTGMFMGHTLLPLPPKLVKKIVSLEYVDMSELRPESWLMEEEGQQQGKCCHAPHRKKTPVKDILTWVQCFASYVSVLAQPYPSKMPQLMAYMCTIIRIEKDFEDNAWQNYDTAYRRQAAITKSLEWGNIEPTLYSMAVTGHSKRRERCTYCFSPDHRTHACPIQQQQQPGLWVQQPQQGYVNQVSQYRAQYIPQDRPRAPKRKQEQDICYLFNAREGDRCHYKECRFAHSCAICRGNHPRSRCDRKRQQVVEKR